MSSDVICQVEPCISTEGPVNRYKHALFIEKEGFNELFKSVRLAEKYDLAIMSTKGMSVTAMRHLVAELSAKGVTIVVLHDFDKAGFSIVNTLRNNTRRWSYDLEPNVVDLGFRLEDVQDLETENMYYNSKVDPRENLIESGAIPEEAAFLRSGGYPRNWTGKRAELNAMTSKQLVDWLERKLQAHNVKKVIPDEADLRDAYIGTAKAYRLEKEIWELIEGFEEKVEVPDNLHEMVKEQINGSTMSWNEALSLIVSRGANGV